MGQISTQAELKKAIADLEAKNKMQQMVIKGQLEQVKEAVKPVNLVRNTFSRFAEIPEVRKTLINTVVGFGLGYVSNKVQKVMSEESLDHLVGNMVNYQVAKIENKNPESMFSKSIHYLRKMIKKESPLYPFLGYKSTY